MKLRSIAILGGLLASAQLSHGAYSYYYSQTFTANIDSTYWDENPPGEPYYVCCDAGNPYYLQSISEKSIISKVAVPDGTGEYEVRTQLGVYANGGRFFVYLHASPDAMYIAGQGTFYAVEIRDVVSTWPTWTGTLRIHKRVGGTMTQLYSGSIGSRDGVQMRSVYRAGQIHVYLDNRLMASVSDSSIPTGQPGLGTYQTTNRIISVDFGSADRTAPSAPVGSTVSSSVRSNGVDLQWQGVVDDASGTGLLGYQVYRNSTFLGSSTTPEFTDETVAAGTTYSYDLKAVDFHQNISAAGTVSVTTAPAGMVDPRRIGVRPTGSYWGGAGEQIDTRSGNLNFTVPLVSAVGRNGVGATVALNYNSQLWRKDGSVHWKLGRDVGFGFGWRMLIGSLTPYWSGSWTLHHYVFTDSSGAEYRLDVNTGGVWTSKDSAYVSFDSNSYKLYFNNGTRWEMYVQSDGTEEDAGTMYPRRIIDSNGNWVRFVYQQGMNSPGGESGGSSARLVSIEDVRSVDTGGGVFKSYTFSYSAEATPHLSGIVSEIGTGEDLGFTYQDLAQLKSPFAGNPVFAKPSGVTWKLLTILTRNGLNLSHVFAYDGNVSGELQRITYPYGGQIGWAYRDFAYVGGRSLREVQYRYLKKQVGLADTTYTFSHDDAGDASLAVHAWTAVDDASGVSRKKWYFETSTASAYLGLGTKFEQLAMPAALVMRRHEYTWTSDANGNRYISANLTTIDPGQSYSKQSKSEQVLDVYGNLTQSKIYDYGNLTTAARTYTNTYLTGSNYASRYIFNRLLTSSVTNGTETFLLANNVYDSYWSPSALYDRSGLTQFDSGYNLGFWHRGNLTRSRPMGSETADAYYRYDITGTVVGVVRQSASVEMTPSMNNAVPGTITPNGDSNLTSTMSYNGYLGLTSSTGPNSTSASSTYDSYARPSSTTSALGAVTTYTYETAPYAVKATTNGRWVRTIFDGFGRTIKTEAGDGAGTKTIVETEYDSCGCTPMGKPKRVSQPYAPGGTVYWTTNTYDALGRTVSVALPNSTGTSSYVYEGNTVKTIDPAGKWKKMTTNAMGSVVTVTEPNPAGGADLTTNYSYNTLNQLLQVSQTRGGTTQLRTRAYNSLGQLVSVTNPENGTVTFAYNDDGTPLNRVDAKGQKTEFVYDSFKRLIEAKSYAAGQSTPDVNQGVQYFYNANSWDFNGQFSAENLFGRLAGVTYKVKDSNGVWRDAVDMFSYTGPGQVKKKAMQIAWQGAPMRLTAEYTYNDEGRVATVKYPTTNTAGKTYALSYDSMARVSGMTENGASLVSGVSYGAAGQMTAMSWAGWTETFSFNARMQMTRSTISGVYDEEYTFSATQNNGQITKKKDWISGEEVNYTYDSLNRMIAASTTGSGGWGSSYSYDGFGNLTAKTATKGTVPPLSVTVDAATNRLTGQSYDANGNQLTAPSGGTLAYDLANRVMSWGSVETYGYNPGNKRVLKTNTSTHVDTLFFYGLDGRRMGTYQLNGCPGGCYLSTVSTEVYFKGRLVKSGNEAVVVDRLGSVRKRKNLSTSVVSTFDYWPYGEEKPSATANNKDKFGTYYRDSSSGLDYADQRYYRNENGRFMSVDPAGSGLNHYGYVGGDPVNRSDPSGLDPIPVSGTSITVTSQGGTANVTMFCPTTGFEIEEWYECPGYEFMSDDYGREPTIDQNEGGPDPLPPSNPCDYSYFTGAQQAMLPDGWGNYAPAQQQQFMNVTSYAAALSVPLEGLRVSAINVAGVNPQPGLFDQTNIEFNGDVTTLVEWLTSGQTTFSRAPAPHAGYDLNFRQNVGEYSMQINISTNPLNPGIQIDIDRYNPMAGALNFIRHMGQVVGHFITASDANPFKQIGGIIAAGAILSSEPCF